MEQAPNQAYILLGSNLGNKEENIAQARTSLQSLGALISASKLYTTAPWNMSTDEWFINQVVCLETELSAHNLLDELLKIEATQGRVRSDNGAYISRTLDLDILYFNSDVISTATLLVPHPRLHERRFTLVPLVEIAPNYVHPLLHQSNTELLGDCKDQSEINDLVLA